MSKVLKTMGKDDSLTIRVNDDSDSIIIAMESKSKISKEKQKKQQYFNPIILI